MEQKKITQGDLVSMFLRGNLILLQRVEALDGRDHVVAETKPVDTLEVE